MKCKIALLTLLLTALTVSSCSGAPELNVEVKPGTVDVLGQTLELTESITITESGVYILSGAIADGQVTVDIPKDEMVEIILNGVDIGCSYSAPFYIKTAERVTITLAEDSVNKLANTGKYQLIDENTVDAVLYSKEDLIIRGEGELHIGARIGNGINSSDDLKIKGGTYNIDVGEHALEANDDLEVVGGALTLKCGKDALHSSNADDTSRGNIKVESCSLTITAGADGFDASGEISLTDATVVLNSTKKGFVSVGNMLIESGDYTIDSRDDAIHTNADLTISDGNITLSTDDDGIHADADLTINGGTLTVVESLEGLEAQAVTINDGTISITAKDDGINSAGGNDGSGIGRGNDRFAVNENCDITINGGSLTIDAGGDGIDSNGNFNVTGGEISVWGPTNKGNSAIDFNGSSSITGGSFIAVGPMGMAQNFGGGSKQCSALVTFGASRMGDIIVKDASGNVIATYSPAKKYSGAVISLPEFKVGESYTFESNGQVQTVKFDSVSVGGEMQGPMGPGAPQGNPPDNGNPPPKPTW